MSSTFSELCQKSGGRAVAHPESQDRTCELMDARNYCELRNAVYNSSADQCEVVPMGTFSKNCVGQGGHLMLDGENHTRFCYGVSARQNCEKSATLKYDFEKDVCGSLPITPVAPVVEPTPVAPVPITPVPAPAPVAPVEPPPAVLQAYRQAMRAHSLPAPVY